MATVLDVMTTPVYVVGPEDTVSHARMTMLSRDVGRLVVVEEDTDTPVGVITKNDIAEGNARNEPPRLRRSIDSQRVSRYMAGRVVTTRPGTGMREVAHKMLDEGVSGLPVVDGEGSLTGIVTKHDLTRHFSESGSGLKVNDIYTSGVTGVHRHSSINHVVKEMRENGIHRVVVKEDNGFPVGIITRSDLAFTEFGEAASGMREKDVKMTRKVEKGGEKRLRSVVRVNLVAEDVMTEDVTSVDMNFSATDAAKLMLERGVSGLPVLGHDDMVGIVTKTDIVRAVAEEGS
ncbi:MAG: hypothetical protein MAG715_00378 [Methanonatronarchaeales archaeon]|nr:hypothetical protein [Methanonatronarchaeales archaeon]